ncbi:MAG: NERD domain-containing protein [Clostridia bacterium]
MIENNKYKLRYKLLLNLFFYTILLAPILVTILGFILLLTKILFFQILGLIFIFGTIYIFNKIVKSYNDIKGKIGETITRLILEQYCQDSHFKTINNIYIKNHFFDNEDIDGISQIDHIVITTKGIAVIETKYHNAYDIYGSELDKTWTYIGKHCKYQRYNPLRQNYGHIKCIENLVDDKSIQFYNIASFMDFVYFKKCNITNKNTKCVFTYDLPKTISDLVINDNTEKIGSAKMSKIISQILEANITDNKIRKAYTQMLKNKYNENKR